MFINSVSEERMRMFDELCVTFPDLINLLRFVQRIFGLENICRKINHRIEHGAWRSVVFYLCLAINSLKRCFFKKDDNVKNTTDLHVD